MGTLLLRLAGPLQSWGADSRFTERKTRHEPTKSGVVGMLASALGRRREDDISDLAELRMAVRIDQAGRYERDFQTANARKFIKKAERWVSMYDKPHSLPLSNRYYLSDAVFVVGIEMDDALLPSFSEALTHPAFPLYLGRRSCPPSGKVLLAARECVDLLSAMKQQPWEATMGRLVSRHLSEPTVSCELLRDPLPTDDGTLLIEQVRDQPISFSQEHRLYAWRQVVHDHVDVTNPHYETLAMDEHNPMAVLEEVI